MSSAEEKDYRINRDPADAATPPEDAAEESTVEESHKKKLLDSAIEVVRQRELRGKSAKNKKDKLDWNTKGLLVMAGILVVTVIMIALLGLWRGRSGGDEQHEVTDAKLLPKEVKYGDQKLPGKVFVGMEATRTEKDPALIAEIQKIIENGGMPSEVFRDDVPPGKNIASELSKSFEIYRDNPAELNALRAEVPYGGDWQIGKDALERVGDVLSRLEQKRLDIRDMLQKPDVCFSFEFTHEPGQEPVPQTDAADFMADYLLLEEFSVARALHENRVKDATDSLAYIFRLAQLAAEVKSPVIRARAADFRIRAVDIMQTILLDPNSKAEHMTVVFGMLQEQLDTWAPEAGVWIGDRASGMKVYNLVRQYGFTGALEPDEIKELMERGLLHIEIRTEKKGKSEKTTEHEVIDREFYNRLPEDEVYYLQTMRQVIESCDAPYYRRVPLLNRIENESRTWRGKPDEKIVAGFLLRYISDGMRRFAQDRAKCEMAAKAMATSLNRSVATKERPGEALALDPLFGRDYEVRRLQSDGDLKGPLVWVSFHSNMRPFRVPDYSAPTP